MKSGATAWQAYCSPDPTAITAPLQHDTSTLPYLQAALMRHLEQFPDRTSGLARTERQILEVIADGNTTPHQIFRAEQSKETSPFMGDTTIWTYIAGMSAGPNPLLKLSNDNTFTLPTSLTIQLPDDSFMQQNIVLTEAGQTILQGKADWIKLRGGIDRWLGGAHLHGPNAQWRWDGQVKKLVAQPHD